MCRATGPKRLQREENKTRSVQNHAPYRGHPRGAYTIRRMLPVNGRNSCRRREFIIDARHFLMLSTTFWTFSHSLVPFIFQLFTKPPSSHYSTRLRRNTNTCPEFNRRNQSSLINPEYPPLAESIISSPKLLKSSGVL